jgi:hypothetical protein
MSNELAEAVLVGRSLLEQCPNVLASRIPPHSLLSADLPGAARGVAVFEKTLSGENLRLAVEKMAAKMNGVDAYPVTVVPVPAHVAQVVVGEDGSFKTPERIMRSILRRYKDHADIRLLDNLNTCWRRFAICKELAHLIMGDDQGQRAVDIPQQLEMALSITTHPRPGNTFTGEEFAWFVAMEMLLPKQDHGELMKRWGNGETSMEIARSYWVPKAIVDLFFETPFAATTTKIP